MGDKYEALDIECDSEELSIVYINHRDNCRLYLGEKRITEKPVRGFRIEKENTNYQVYVLYE